MLHGRIQLPRVLMISHCLPDPTGHRQAARAWQLLRMASQTHQVDLACATAQPMHLSQWRSASSVARRLVVDRICPGPLGMGVLACGWLNPVGSPRHRERLAHGIERMTRDWTSQQTYDAVLCTHPMLWDIARDTAASQHLCDLGDAGDAADASFDALYRQVLSQCPSITLSHASAISWKAGLPAHVTQLPHAVDLAHYETPQADDALPRLALHVDRSHAAGRALWEWFTREVWRKVQQAVPQTILCGSHRRDMTPPRQALAQASVIVTPQAHPRESQWAVLQSMAMARPVIASGQTADGLNVRHGEHLLLSHKPSHWVEHCVESLRSATIRLRLAQAGRAFVQAHHSLEKNLAALPWKRPTMQPTSPDKQAPLRMAA